MKSLGMILALSLAAHAQTPADLRGIYISGTDFPVSKQVATDLTAALAVPGVDVLLLGTSVTFPVTALAVAVPTHVTITATAPGLPGVSVSATVPIAAGQNTVSFSNQCNSVSAATAVGLMASYAGPLAPLGANATTTSP
jgi:hypothetical protein